MSSTHRTAPTPNPSERSLIVTINEETMASNGGLLPPQGTRYDSELFRGIISKDYRKEFADFVYSNQVGDYGLAFARDKTTAQANTPFRSTRDMKNHHWPRILLALAVIPDNTYPNSTSVISGTDQGIVQAPMYYAKYALIDEVEEGTWFITDEFFGPRPFDIPFTPVPITSSVHVEVLGRDIDIPNCLHPTIRIGGTQTGTTMLVAGSASSAGGALNGQIFPATNFETWAPYVLTDQQEYRDGGWYRVRVRVLPPSMPDPIIGFA